MTVNRGLFVRNNGTVGTTPIQGRLVLASLVAENAPGTPRNGILDPKTTSVVTGKTDMSYDVSAITAVVNRAAGEGVYLFTTTGTTNVATTAAPGTGSRYDLIYVLQRDLDKGDSDNTAVLAVYQGTAASSPTKPYASLPAGALVLAEALVNSGATATNGSGVTITQVWRYTALRGAPIPVRNTTERDEITPAPGMLVRRLDISQGYVETYNGTIWGPSYDRPFGHAGRTAGFQSMATADTSIVLSSAQVLHGGMTFDASGGGRLVAPVAGYYRINAQYYFSGSSNCTCFGNIYKNGSLTLMGGRANFWKGSDGSDMIAHATTIVQLAAGDKIGIGGQSAASAWGSDGYNGCYLEMELLTI